MEKRMDTSSIPAQRSKVKETESFYLQSFSSSSPFSGKETEKGTSSSSSGDEVGMGRSKRKRGGIITIPFILANDAFEKTASYGLQPNMILYLMRGYRVSFAEGNKILFLWHAAINFMPIVGAFLADSYLGRFLTICLGCLFSLLGMILLWLTAMIPQAKPPSCNIIQSCKSATAGQFALLISSFGAMSVGAGGVRSSSIAFGADQLDNKEIPNNERVLESYFAWYYGVTSFSILIAITVIVYIQDHFGMKVGLGIPAILMLLSALFFLLAAPLYVKHKPNQSLFTGLAQVLVAAYKNRKLAIPPLESGWYHHEKGSAYTLPTDKLRFLNKACILRSPEDVTPSGVASNPWRLCTVKQVEELKALVKVIPLWSAGIMMSVNTGQNSVTLLQANTMDRHVTSKFQIPAGSYMMFLIATVTIWVILYDRVILPLGSKIKGKRVFVGTKVRMGAGLFSSAMAMVVAGVVEHIRRRKAIEQGLLNKTHALVGMSAMWLVPQFSLLGLAEALNAIGQIEFYYTEFPKTMASISSSLYGLGMAVANLLATVILSAVDKYTKREGNGSWVASNVNQGRYDYYYWMLAAFSVADLFYYFVCSWAYGPCADEMKEEEEDGLGVGVGVGVELEGMDKISRKGHQLDPALHSE